MAARVLGIGARLHKLRAMSASEIVHRLQYHAALVLERREHAASRLTPPDRLRRAVGDLGKREDWTQRLLALRKGHRHRFFPSVGERDAIRELFETRYTAEREATMRAACDARKHRFQFFGRVFEYGSDIPWQADPVTGRHWPSSYHADVPVHGGDVGYGDVKDVWELSRQQFLIDLGKSWFLFRRDDDLHAVRRLVRSWIAGNPYATGVNWACALEPAFRVFSWLWAYFLTVDGLDDEFHVEWLESLYDHGRFIDRHLEHYASPYNHLIGEAAALYMLGVCFPEFEDSPRWKAAATNVLTGRLGEQFYADGGSVEQSTFYHHATVGFYLMAALAARAAGGDLPAAIWAAIERGLDFSLALSQPDGSTPAIGGADDGKPIRLEHLPFWDFRPYLAVGAVVFNRSDFKHAAGRFHEDALWLTGTRGVRAFDRLESRVPERASAALPASGYFVLRSGWNRDADYICFDCGEQAAGMRQDAIANSMHGHADCLSLVAWLRGKPVLVDSGLYAYNCGGAWEAHFRETAAHNTARIDGRDQARHIGKMAWSHSYRATQEGWSEESPVAWVIGSHDGYTRGPSPVRHRRAVWLRPHGYAVIYDEFEGTGVHDLEINFQFAPGMLEPRDGYFLFEGDVHVAFAGSQPWTAHTSCGGTDPADGWVAPSLGIRRAAPRLSMSCRTSAPRSFLLTVVATVADSLPGVFRALTVEHTESHYALIAVSASDAVDIVAAGNLSKPAPVASDARVVVCRIPLARDGAVETRRLGGTRADVETDAIARLAGARVPAPEVGG